MSACRDGRCCDQCGYGPLEFGRTRIRLTVDTETGVDHHEFCDLGCLAAWIAESVPPARVEANLSWLDLGP